MNTENPRLTIGIPIHGGERWLDGVTSNVSRVPPWSRVVISDASHLDNAAAVLTETYRDDPNVEVVSRPGTLNLVEHANLLLDEAGTEYFCWLPQDDLASPADYFTLLVDALDSRPDCVLAFFFFNVRATTFIYTCSLIFSKHDALPISPYRSRLMKTSGNFPSATRSL